MKNLKAYCVMVLALLTLLIGTSACSAMMRNPIEIGSIKFDLYRDTGFSFVGAKNQGTHHYSDARRAYTNGYSNGLASFDGGQLFVDYDIKERGSRCLVGEYNNNIEVGISDTTIYSVVDLDRALKFYVLLSDGAFVVFGKDYRGKCVKYVDSGVVERILFDGQDVFYTNLETRGDALVIKFKAIQSQGGPRFGELVLPWSDQYQWFGVEKIVY